MFRKRLEPILAVLTPLLLSSKYLEPVDVVGQAEQQGLPYLHREQATRARSESFHLTEEKTLSFKA